MKIRFTLEGFQGGEICHFRSFVMKFISGGSNCLGPDTVLNCVISEGQDSRKQTEE